MRRLGAPAGVAAALGFARELVEAIRRGLGRRCLFVPVPSRAALGLLLVAERLPGVRLPISSSNVRGLRESGRGRLHSDLETFGVSPRSVDELVAQALADPRL